MNKVALWLLYYVVPLLYILFWVAFLIGWVLNIVDIAYTTSLPMTGMFILRIIGVFVAPIGAFLGLFTTV